LIKRIKLGNRYIVLGLQKCHTVKGITSLCKDGKHILFWDLDGIDNKENSLIQKLIGIQTRYDLSNIYLFRSSSKNYHAYCLKKLTFEEMFDIICKTPHTDPNFLIWTARRYRTTLRVTPKTKDHKLKFLRCINGYGRGEGSMAHKIFLSSMIPNGEKYFSIELLKWDNHFDITAVEYDTGEI